MEGKIAQHPAGAEGLVLELIDPSYGNLAGPPSLATCTRDVDAPGTTFTLAAVNIFDRDPPFARLDPNYDSFTASPLGFTLKAGVSQKF